MVELDRRDALRLLSGGALGAALAGAAGAGTASGLSPTAAAPPGRFPAEAACLSAIRQLPMGRGVTYGVGVHDSVSGRRFVYDPYGAWEMASTVKVDLLLGVLRRAQAADRPLSARERALARTMIISSDNRAASRLWAANGGAAGMLRLWQRIGLDDMRPGANNSWGLTRTSVRSRLRMLDILVDGHPAIDSVRANEVVWLMRDVGSGQRWGVGGAAHWGEMSEIKNGWLPRSSEGRRWIVNTTGRVHARVDSAPQGRIDVRMVVLSRGHASLSAGVTFAERVLRTARRLLGV